MKKFLKAFTLSLLFFLGSMATAQAAPFLATFRTTSANESITLPLITGYTYDFTVDWGDGSLVSEIDSYNDADRVHNYVSTGDHQISITGTMPMWNFNTVNTSKNKILSLDDDGDVGFGTGVTNMGLMFNNASELTTVALFDTSSATDMRFMFARTGVSTVPLFNTTAVTDMTGMFSEASALTTVPLFDTSSVLNMQSMFTWATSLPTVPLFDTSSVENMNQMFYKATSLTTVPLLDTSSVTNMNQMFRDATALTTVSLFNTGAVTNMTGMFQGAGLLATVPLFDTSAVTSMNGMFASASSLTTIPSFNTSLVTDFRYMFNGASSLTTIPLIDTSGGTSFFRMFFGASSLTSIPLLDTSAGEDMSQMFYNASSLTTVPLFDASLVTLFTNMFYGADSVTQGALSGTRYAIDYSATNMGTAALQAVFAGLGTAAGSQTIDITGNPGQPSLDEADYAVAINKGWTVEPAYEAPFLATFRTTGSSESITLPTISGHTYNFTVDWGDETATSDITTYNDADRIHTYATAGDYQISITGSMPMWNFNTVTASKDKIISLDDDGDVGFGVGVTNMSNMFNGASALTTVALFDTSAATDMSYMFAYTSALTTVPLFDTSSATLMHQMFRGTALTTVPLFDTSSVTLMVSMFNSASNLTTVPLFDTSSATDMRYMFANANSLTTVPLFDTSLVTLFTSMFNGASSVTQGALSGTRYDIDYSSTNMELAALRDVLTNLGTAAGAQTVTLTGNPGQLSLTEADYSGAESKGWTIVPAYAGPVSVPDNFCSSGDISTLTNPLADLIYWDWDGNSPYLANSGGTAVVAIVAPAETVLTTAEITTLDGSAEPGMVYFDEDTGELFISDASGDLQDPSTITSNAVADTDAVEASAVAGEVYFNTTTGEVFFCEVDGTLDTPADPSSSCLTQ